MVSHQAVCIEKERQLLFLCFQERQESCEVLRRMENVTAAVTCNVAILWLLFLSSMDRKFVFYDRSWILVIISLE